MSSGIEFDHTFLPLGAVAPPCLPDVVQLGAFEPRSVVAGPGERAVIWVTGCLRRCPGCMKPEWFDFKSGHSVSVADLATRVLSVHAASPLAGVTFSGGEPFEQAEPLTRLAAILHDAGLDVLTYSGYQLATLKSTPRFAKLLDQTDWLIDGEYRRDRPGPLRWRGSDNQKIHVRQADGEHDPIQLDDPPLPLREVMISVTANGLRISGFPNNALRKSLQKRLQVRGISLVDVPS